MSIISNQTYIYNEYKYKLYWQIVIYIAFALYILLAASNEIIIFYAYFT